MTLWSYDFNLILSLGFDSASFSLTASARFLAGDGNGLIFVFFVILKEPILGFLRSGFNV
jgi:hypothetical protein